MARSFGTSITVPGNPTLALELTPKQYVDALVADAGNLTTGTMPRERLPRVLNVVRTVSPVAGQIDFDASIQGNTVKHTLASNAELNVPTNGVEDQVIQGLVLANGAQVILTFDAGFGRLTGINSTLTIPTGKVGRYVIRYVILGATPRWIVESVGVEQ